MNKYILTAIVIAIIAAASCVVSFSIGQQGVRPIDIGTFVVVTFTLIALIFYANDTNKITKISQSKWQRESVLNSTYEMLGTGDTGGEGRILFRINNPSSLIVSAKVLADFKVYGIKVDAGPAYNGTEIWSIFPNQQNQGWYAISNLLLQQGKNVQQLISECSPQNETNQLTLDLTIEFRDELGNKRKLPTRKHYFAFKQWTWIPIFTEIAGW